jgi:hypothetical protein
MGKILSKNKGNGFEREISNLLSKTFESYLGITTGFKRNSDSGSFYGGTNSKRVDTHCLDYAIFGDIICPRNFNFVIECKNYKTAPSLDRLISQDIKQWDTWLSQVEQDANNANKEPLLIIKYNRMQVFCLVKNCNTPTNINYKNYNIYNLEEFLKQKEENIEYFFSGIDK